MALDANTLWLQHKPKWRPTRYGVWHCYVTFGPRKFESMCGRKWPIKASTIGSSCSRPPCSLRCVQCDLGEIKMGRADESYLESAGWERQLL